MVVSSQGLMFGFFVSIVFYEFVCYFAVFSLSIDLSMYLSIYLSMTLSIYQVAILSVLVGVRCVCVFDSIYVPTC